jgi:hypothetical protein
VSDGHCTDTQGLIDIQRNEPKRFHHPNTCSQPQEDPQTCKNSQLSLPLPLTAHSPRRRHETMSPTVTFLPCDALSKPLDHTVSTGQSCWGRCPTQMGGCWRTDLCGEQESNAAPLPIVSALYRLTGGASTRRQGKRGCERGGFWGTWKRTAQAGNCGRGRQKRTERTGWDRRTAICVQSRLHTTVAGVQFGEAGIGHFLYLMFVWPCIVDIL